MCTTIQKCPAAVKSGTPASLDPMSHPDQRATFAAHLRRLRQASGLSIDTAAGHTGVTLTTWRRWEQGASTPRLYRGGAIARALGVPVAALFVDEVAGYRAVSDVVLSPDGVERVKREGLPAAEALAALVAAQLPALILEAVRPRRPSRDGRSKPRRTRAEVLAGIDDANRSRAARRAADQAAGGPEGRTRERATHEPGSSSFGGGIEALSMLQAEQDEVRSP